MTLAVAVRLRDHHSDNDPLNKQDPLGLRPEDDELVYEDPCIHLAKDPDGDGIYDDIGLFEDDGVCGYLVVTGPEPGPLNPAEFAWCMSRLGANMAICLDVAAWSQQANRLANEYWQQRGGDGGVPYSGYSPYGPPDGSPGNAFKHMFWSGMIAHHYGKSIAKQLTDAHEVERNTETSVSRRMHRQMDFANNFYGRELGSQHFSMVLEISWALRHRVGGYIKNGLACTRSPGNPDTATYDGPFVREDRCGFA